MTVQEVRIWCGSGTETLRVKAAHEALMHEIAHAKETNSLVSITTVRKTTVEVNPWAILTVTEQQHRPEYPEDEDDE